MDFKTIGVTFLTIFIAEIGDKTQFAAVAAASGSNSKLSVLLGVILALSCAGALGVGLGSLLSGVMNPRAMQLVSGCIFLAIGAWTLWGIKIPL
jgi:putative Ca2+/H+ antiporter (TMEM165/GDT1 family)